MDISKVSEKNTKAEILEAYRRLYTQIREGKGVEKPKASFRDQILSKVEDIETKLASKFAEAEQLDKKIEELKKRLRLGETIEFTQEKLEEIKEETHQEERNWQNKSKQLQSDLEEEERWKRERLEKQLKQREWEFELEKKKKEREILEKEKEFERRAVDYKNFKAQVEAFPERLEKTKEATSQDIEKRLKIEFESEIKYAHQEFASEKSLLEQTIQNLQTRLEEYKSEVKGLNQQLATANQQIKQLAVTALRSSEPHEKETPKEEKE